MNEFITGTTFCEVEVYSWACATFALSRRLSKRSSKASSELPMTSLDTLLHRMRACIVWRGAASLLG